MSPTGTESLYSRRPVQSQKATADRHGEHLLLLEDERAQDRSLISRQSALLERQARLLEACRRVLGDQTYEALKRQLLEWLAEPPVGERVMAFASAPAAQGGPGATLVLLRRRRARR